MLENLNLYRIILASNSPRRQELLRGLGVDFEVKTLPDVCEDYPSTLSVYDVAKFIAKEKAEAYTSCLLKNDLIITADTVVISDGKVLGKPKNGAEAYCMIKQLSGKQHEVVTGVCVQTKDKTILFDTLTEVLFAELSDDEINYYIDKYSPYDKAGAYGVQEWIGYVGVEAIKGSYFNVMGLPVQKLYQVLKDF